MNDATHKRLFIGVPIDDLCQQQIDAVLAPLRINRHLRWTAAHNRHMTLAFLGETADNALQNLLQHFTDAYAHEHATPFELTALTRFPEAQGAILAAVNTPSPALLKLYQATKTLLTQCQVVFEERDYHPHITLARIRSPRQLHARFDQRIALQLQIDHICLYQSVVTQHGREYQVLAQATLAKNS